jgi:hypothetical protein
MEFVTTISRRLALGLGSARTGYLLDALALAVLIALLVDYALDHSTGFSRIVLPIMVAFFAAAAASMLVRRTSKSIVDFMLATAVMAIATVCSELVPETLPAAPAAQARPSPPPSRADIFEHSLPGDLALFSDGFDKTRLRSFSELARAADRYHRRWVEDLRRQGFSAGEAKAISLMLFTSTLWAYGNEVHTKKPGCITINEDNGWHRDEPTLQVFKRARIGCCTDYAHALSLVLSKNGIENRYVLVPGHIFNEALIDGKWGVLDANTNMYIASSWTDAIEARNGVQAHVFPHPGQGSGRLHRPAIGEVRQIVLDMVRYGRPKTTIKEGRLPDPRHRVAVKVLY